MGTGAAHWLLGLMELFLRDLPAILQWTCVGVLHPAAVRAHRAAGEGAHPQRCIPEQGEDAPAVLGVSWQREAKVSRGKN